MSTGFDKLAPWYGILESLLFGSRLQEMRCAYLDQLKDAGTVLLVGEGTGLFLERLLKANPEATVSVVEPSAKMIDQCRKRVPSGDCRRVTFHKSTLLEFESAQRFDALCTFFFWDCFDEDQLRVMLPAIFRFHKPESFWIDADFFEMPKGAHGITLCHFLLLRMLYGFFGLATGIEARRVVDIEPMAKQNGFFVNESLKAKKFPIQARIFSRRI